MYNVLGRVGAQMEVSILSSYLRTPTTEAIEALRQVTMCMLRTQDAYIKLEVQSGEPVLVELVGTPTAIGLASHRSGKSQSSGHVREPMFCCVISLEDKVEAASCGTAEVPTLLHLRATLGHFEVGVGSVTLWQRVGLRNVLDWQKSQGFDGEDARDSA